jgi:hypothetical protein
VQHPLLRSEENHAEIEGATPPTSVGREPCGDRGAMHPTSVGGEPCGDRGAMHPPLPPSKPRRAYNARNMWSKQSRKLCSQRKKQVMAKPRQGKTRASSFRTASFGLGLGLGLTLTYIQLQHCVRPMHHSIMPWRFLRGLQCLYRDLQCQPVRGANTFEECH